MLHMNILATHCVVGAYTKGYTDLCSCVCVCWGRRSCLNGPFPFLSFTLILALQVFTLSVVPLAMVTTEGKYT